MTVEKIEAGEVRLGDMIGTRKSGPFDKVIDIQPGESSAYIRLETLEGHWYRIRPRFVTKVWRRY